MNCEPIEQCCEVLDADGAMDCRLTAWNGDVFDDVDSAALSMCRTADDCEPVDVDAEIGETCTADYFPLELCCRDNGFLDELQCWYEADGYSTWPCDAPDTCDPAFADAVADRCDLVD